MLTVDELEAECGCPQCRREDVMSKRKASDWPSILRRIGFEPSEHSPTVFVATNMSSGATLKVGTIAGFPEPSLYDHDGHTCRLDGFSGPNVTEERFRQLCGVLGIPSDD